VYLDADAKIDQIDLFAGVDWMCLFLAGDLSRFAKVSFRAGSRSKRKGQKKILPVGDVIE
jgi:hypothetical protein